MLSDENWTCIVKTFDRNTVFMKFTVNTREVIVPCKHYVRLSHPTRKCSQYTYNFFATVFATEAELIYMTDSCVLPSPMSDPQSNMKQRRNETVHEL